jgi:N-acetylneuraminic acid mutarotase
VWKGTRSVIANLQPTSEPVWQENAPMPTPRYGLATAVYENFIYAIAGETGDTVSGRVERYDPSTNSWRTLKEKPTAVSDVSAVVLGGKIYIPGGRLASGSMTDILEIYDPRLDTWSIGASLPISLSAYALASFEGKLYLFGGWDGKSYLATTYEYDPEKDLWTPEPDLPTPRAYAGAAVAGRKIYVFGGYNGKEALAANEAFLPDRSDDPAQAWETATPMPTAGYAMGVSGVADSIYIVGGLGNTNQPIREMYLFQNGEWNSLESYPQLVGSNLGLIDLSTYLYAIGGIIRKKPSDANLSYKALYTISVPIISK